MCNFGWGTEPPGREWPERGTGSVNRGGPPTVLPPLGGHVYGCESTEEQLATFAPRRESHSPPVVLR